ncbi:DUF5590 domain-containing protein [Halobacillus campisalis]
MIETQPSSRFTVPKWVRWVLVTLGVLLIIFIGVLTWMYLHIEDSRTSQFAEASNFAESEGLLTDVKEVARYNGEFPVYIAFGENSDGVETYVFINLAEKEEMTSIPKEDMISESTAVANGAQCTGCEFIDVQLAYEENRPVWEVTYTDESSRYVFEYLDVENGEEVQRFAFRQTQS